MLEIASALNGYSFGSTIKLIAFNVEEQGLVGSKAYANEAEANGDNILSMINFDMIGYTGADPNPDLEVMGDQWLVDAMISSVEQYTSISAQAHYGNVYGSDHYYFHSSQYTGSSSILNIENTPAEIWGGSNPYYHTTGDVSGNLNFGFAIDVAKAGLATIANLASPISAPIPEPSTIILLGIGIVGLTGIAVRGRFKNV